jgi:hypothetical protein
VKKIALIVLSIVAAGCALVIAFVAIMAMTAKPAPAPDEVRTSLAPGDRDALEILCRAAGVDWNSLRPIFAWDDRLMASEENRASFSARDGRIRSIGLTAVGLETVPDLSALTELESLWLPGNRVRSADLRALAKLQTVNLERNGIASLDAIRLPANLQRLFLSDNEIEDLRALASLPGLRELTIVRNRVTDLAPLASARELTTLDTSHNRVTSFDALLELRLEKLNLASNRIAAFPAMLPSAPATWKVNLDDNPVLNPPGYMRNRTYKIAYGGSGGGRVSQQGVVANGKFEVTGTWEHLPALRNVELNTLKGTTRAIGEVVLEATIKKGRARFYLIAPGTYWSSPWIERGLIEGFGFFNKVDWLYADGSPEQPVRLQGALADSGGHDPVFEFHMEPLDGAPAEEITYRVYRP